MPKPRTRRKDVRSGRKRKHDQDDVEVTLDAEEDQTTKRPRLNDEEAPDQGADNDGYDNGYDDTTQQQHHHHHQESAGEAQFFGLLSDEEQEYFRGAAEVLELNDFAAPEDRAVFVENVFKEAQGKELKLACSQSCSRLMEKLILLSNKAQKKHLFEAFAGSFLSLVQHRFASHCCEMLFLQSVPLVGEELPGFVIDVEGNTSGGGGEDGAENKPESSMEQLFLLTLDELEADLTFLLTQTYASHSLRALLLILSGRPLENASTAALLKSKKKERISIPGAAPAAENAGQQLRAVPESFTMATKKIITDTMLSMDNSSLRILVTHPTGNPLLQLLLELDISLNVKSKSKDNDGPSETLLDKLLPGLPDSLKDDTSKASEFITGLVYDQIGSRLLETLVDHTPGKLFKVIYQNFFAQRIASYVRNEIASYPSIKVLHRLSKEDLVDCVKEILPVVPTLIEKSRFNVVKTLFERCAAREATYEIRQLTDAVVGACACDNDAKNLAPASASSGAARTPVINHGAHLVTAMLGIKGPAAAAAQTSLLDLSPEELLKLATGSMATMSILTAALANPTSAPTPSGHNVINAIVTVPSKGRERSIPFHLKEAFMSKLAENEATLRDSWMGRSVWRTWKGDVWKRGRADWAKWAREAGDGADQAFAGAPAKRDRHSLGPRSQRNPNRDTGSWPAVPPANPYVARRLARKAEREKQRARDAAFDQRRNGGYANGTGHGATEGEKSGEAVEVVEAVEAVKEEVANGASVDVAEETNLDYYQKVRFNKK
ncbi:unnamed protein product [Parascedosporium putredinis]|uniref:Nucleolar protein 9 n=1 Tax=Parascedosporium putredinis TaxID=1442378 RepID=A0A9P1H291_9PEZI|nr:unnamed protein product [Parascedosporium putredinis]CAI7994725.1 unnamed protein product [Parascedosporium putredinis]